MFMKRNVLLHIHSTLTWPPGELFLLGGGGGGGLGWLDTVTDLTPSPQSSQDLEHILTYTNFSQILNFGPSAVNRR